MVLISGGHLSHLYMMAQTEESLTAIVLELAAMLAAEEFVPLSVLSFALYSVISPSSVLPTIVRAGIAGAGVLANILPTNFLPMLPFACEVLFNAGNRQIK